MKIKYKITIFSLLLMVFVLSLRTDLGYAIGFGLGAVFASKDYSRFIKFNEMKSKIFIRAVYVASLSGRYHILISSKRKRVPDNFDVHTYENDYKRIFFFDEQMELPHDADLLFAEEELYYKKNDGNSLYIYVPRTTIHVSSIIFVQGTFEAKQKHTKINGINVFIYFIDKNDEIIENYKENGLKKINVYNGIEK